ncbi:hypothetical protein [Brevibacillus fulvus]|uniref:Uncharacterized protein n=1 Tax=Brevibacillus fulvus TaxID=1125967 RepID=A0A939BPB3_9BACL|nr:hypothetical protein [Brevibacillus fulvus]MBM7590265.1 hypothetical protein [Brevibacillus fulvus]
MRLVLYTLLILLYIINQFLFQPTLDYATGVIAVLALGISAVYARGLYRVSGFVFLLLGLLLFFWNGLVWHSIFLHFQTMLGLLSFFLVLPFIHSLIRVGRYDKNLSQFLQDRVTAMPALYKRSSLVCHFLGIFLNIAAIPLLTRSLEPSLQMLPKRDTDKFFSNSLLRSYALCLMWSPMEVLVSLTVDFTQTPYYWLLPIIVFNVLAVLLIDWALSGFRYKNISIPLAKESRSKSAHVSKKMLHLLGMLLVFVLLVSLVQHIVERGFLFSVVLLLIPFSFLWAAASRKAKSYLALAAPYWKQRTNGLADFFFMFLSAGLFVDMLSLSGLLSFLEPVFLAAAQTPFVLYLLIAGYFLLTSFIGLHSLVSLTFLLQFLLPVLPEVAGMPLAIVIITCALSPVMYSPFNLSVSMLTSELRISPYRIAGWNVGFAILCMLFGILVSALLEQTIY